MITGHDLVEWQLRVACGEALPVRQEDLKIHGHAIEARIYAENPDKGFLPAIGTLTHMAQPAAVEFQRNADGEALHDPAPVRVDAGVRAGDAISPHYDPMIAKLIVWGHNREQALARLRGALAETHIVGLANNVDFLGRLATNHAFAIAQLDTGLIERERANLFAHEDKLPNEFLALACARVLADEAAAVDSDPWSWRNGWRLNGTYTRELTFKSERGVHDVKIEYARGAQGRASYHYEHAGLRAPLLLQASAEGAATTRLNLQLADRTLHADVVHSGDELHVFLGGRHRVLTLVDVIAHAGEGEAVEGRLSAPMPGKVIAVNASKGARVARGTPLLVMEAMKMEHTIVAPADGVVDEILFGVGEQVAEGAPLVQFTPAA
jgi:3-methylcrotonyl-CoA carboxylase alpha subunit